jgi:hypothetical protein
MITKHPNMCANNCKFALKSVFLSRAGTDEEYLYRCQKIDRLITTDSTIYDLGCASYDYDGSKPASQESTTVQRAKELLKEIDKELEVRKEKELKPVITVPQPPVQAPVVAPAATAPVLVRDKAPDEIPTQKQSVLETTKPVESVIVQKPAITPPLGSVVSPVINPPQPPKEPPKKRGRKPKQIIPEPIQSQPVQPTNPEPKGVVEDNARTDPNL